MEILCTNIKDSENIFFFTHSYVSDHKGIKFKINKERNHWNPEIFGN